MYSSFAVTAVYLNGCAGCTVSIMVVVVVQCIVMVEVVMQCILMDIYTLALRQKLTKYELYIIINTKVTINTLNVAEYIYTWHMQKYLYVVQYCTTTIQPL